jgi:3-deoxy-D-manno-octulosonic-acid transferase
MSAGRSARRESPAGGTIWSGIYNALWYPALPFALRACSYDVQSRSQRLGRPVGDSDSIGSQRPRIWLHAASVGEVEGVRPLVMALSGALPELQLIITSMTVAGRDAARRRLGGVCQLAPLDYAAAVRAFLAHVRPVLVIIAETELWPNFFLQSVRADAQVAIVNGRISKRSMRSYSMMRPLIARMLSGSSLVMVQTADDAERFRALGAPADRVVVTGNTKYELESEPPPLRPALAGFAAGHPILLAGSTAPGEERTIVSAYSKLLERCPALALIIAPRHLNRREEIERELGALGIAFTRASELDSLLNPAVLAHGQGSAPHPPVLLLDTMGELRSLYRRAAIAFVGGTMTVGRGGQSLAEPAAASVPVLFGPFYENHKQVGDALIAAAAGEIAQDESQLVRACSHWLADDETRTAAGQRGRAAIEQLSGATAECMRHLLRLLPATRSAVEQRQGR